MKTLKELKQEYLNKNITSGFNHTEASLLRDTVENMDARSEALNEFKTIDTLIKEFLLVYLGYNNYSDFN